MFGKWHGLIPKDPEENVAFRLDLARKCHDDRAFRRSFKELCARDICVYVDTMVWQYNPKKLGGLEAGPFILWDFQVGALKLILNSIHCTCNDSSPHGHDLLLEKSREMGVSWLCLIAFEWLWHFHPWKKFLCISRSEDAVEDDDPDSLFWKIDFIHRFQPSWILPTIRRRKKFFGNVDLNSDITGQASTGKAGVGGRATAMFIDELSQINEAFEVVARTSDTTNCRIFCGTHKGTGTAFHDLSCRPDMRKLVLHWSQHPDKNKGVYRYDAAKGQVEVLDKSFVFPADFKFVMSEAPSGGPHPGLRSPWYDLQCSRKPSQRAVAEDLDIDPGGSASQFFNPLTIRSLRHEYARNPDWEGDIIYDRDTGQPAGLSEDSGGAIKLWLRPTMDGKIPAGKYAGGADISTGGGATNSVLSIVNARTGEKVCEYASATILPEHYAVSCVALMRLFKDEDGYPALFGWEFAGPGLIFGKRVVELGYPYVYYRTSLINNTKKLLKAKEPGWYPQNQHKRMLLEEYRSALEQREFVNFSDIALKECGPYHYTSQGSVEHPSETLSEDPTGARVNHGDRVIADALAWKMVKTMNVYKSRQPWQEEPEQVGSLAWRRKLSNDELNLDPWQTSEFDGWAKKQIW